MKLRVTRTLYEHWNTQRGGRRAPHRGDIVPGAIRYCLGDAFILAAAGEHHRFRIAGTSLCAMFGLELTGGTFETLWAHHERSKASSLLQAAGKDAEAIVADVTGRNVDSGDVDLEMILLPLVSSDATGACLLGALTPVTTPYWLGTRPLRSLHLADLPQARLSDAEPQRAGALLRASRSQRLFTIFSRLTPR